MLPILARRDILKAGSLLALNTAWPRAALGTARHTAFEDIPRSAFGAQTTAGEVVSGLDLTGLTILITGVNSGLGQESMRVLAARGAHIIGTARTLDKAREACGRIEGRTTPLACELSDFDSVVACTDAVDALGLPLDVLMCNAGIMALPKLERVYGIERQFVVNHLGHYLLTRRLLNRVRAARQGRIVMVSSVGYRNAPPEGIDFDNLGGEKGYKPFPAYGRSKLANALFAFELARRHADTPIAANAIHPGMIATNLGRHFMKQPVDPDAPLRPGFKTVEQGAATQVYVAAHPQLDGVSGFYFEDCNPVLPDGPHMNDAALARRLWEVSEELTRNWL